MTVNKSQGQTIPNVGVYLPAPVFSHGQLYVAMSRATNRTNIKILALAPNAEAEEEEARRQENKDAKKSKGQEKTKWGSQKTKKSITGEWHVYEEYCIQGGFDIVGNVI
jgi:ATP-dependent DNA helicase PIF1